MLCSVSPVHTRHNAPSWPFFQKLGWLFCGALCFTIGLCIPSAMADQVFIKGEKEPIEGKILSVGNDEVLIEISEGRQLPLLRSKVERMELGNGKKPGATPPVPEAPIYSARPVQAAPKAVSNIAKPDPGLRPAQLETATPADINPGLRPIIVLPDTPALDTSEFPPLRTQPVSTSNNSKNNAAMNHLMYSPVIPPPPSALQSGLATLQDDAFVSLSRFKGHVSQGQYMGLYNFLNKGTLWIRLPQPQPETALLRFTLYGKQHRSPEKSTELTLTPGPESFGVEVRFLDDQGNALGDTPLVQYQQQQGLLVEWFHLLENMSGLCDPMEVSLSVPAGTKIIEFRVVTAPDAPRHLVGYLGQVQLGTKQ